MAPPRRIEAALGDDDGCSTLSTLPCDKTLRLGRCLDVADDDSFLDAPPPGIPAARKAAIGAGASADTREEEGTEEGAYETASAAAAASSSPNPASEAPRRQSLDLARRLGAAGGVRGRTTSGLASAMASGATAPIVDDSSAYMEREPPRRTAVDPPDGAVGPDVRCLSHSADGNGAMSRQRSPSFPGGPFFSRSDGALLAARRGGWHRGRGASFRRGGDVGAVPLDCGGRGRSGERRQQRVHSRSEGGRRSMERWWESLGSDGAVTGSEYGYRRCDGRRRQPESCDRMDGDSLAGVRRDGWATRSEGGNCWTRSAHCGRRRRSGKDGREHCYRSWDGRGAAFRKDPHRWTEEGRSSVDECAHGNSCRCLSRRSRSSDASPMRIRLRRSRSCDERSVEGNDHGRYGSSDVVSRRSWKSATSTVVSRMRRFPSLPRSLGGRVETAVLDDPYDEDDDDGSCSSFCSCSSSSSSSFSSNEDDERSHESSDDDEGLDGRSAMSVADAVHYLNGRRGKVMKERFRSRFLSSLSVA